MFCFARSDAVRTRHLQSVIASSTSMSKSRPPKYLILPQTNDVRKGHIEYIAWPP